MSFRLLPEETQKPIINSEQSSQSKFRLLPEEQTTKTQEGIRHVARSASRIGETLAGLPGDIIEAPANLMNYAIEKITGKPNEGFREAKKTAKKFLPFGNVPSSGEIREKTKELSGGYLEPKGKGEELSDAIVSDFASLAIPIKGKIPFLRSLGTSLGANLAAEGAELLGAGEKGKAATKIGSMFLLSAFKPNGAKKFGDDLYKQAEKLVPEGATVSAENLLKSTEKLKEQLKKGGSAPYKTPALTKINEIASKVDYDRIPVDELTQFKIDINKARSSLYGDVNLDKGGRAMAKRNLDSTAKVVDDALKEYGHANPEWQKAYRSANEVYGAIAQSKQVSNSIQKLIKSYPHASAAALAGKLFLAPKSTPALVAGYGALKTGELITRIAKSKTLQGYYQGVVKAALKDDAAAMSKYLNKLDAGLKKEDSSNRNPT